MSAPSHLFLPEADTSKPITMYGPDFPFAYDDWLKHPSGLGSVPVHQYGAEVAIIGAGMAGMAAAHELMKMGLKPVVYEASRIGGRLRSQPFEGAEGIIAELGGMRFPGLSTAFYHYVNMLGIEPKPFPNPLSPPGTNSTVIDLEGETDLCRAPPTCCRPSSRKSRNAWTQGAGRRGRFSELHQAMRERDTARVKEIWNRLVPIWDDRTFYDFVATSYAFGQKSFRHREVFGQVGFGTGGWDSDFPNSMLEILRVVCTDCDENQRFIVGGVRAGAPWPVAYAAGEHGALAQRHQPRQPARRRDAARRAADRA